MTQSSEQQAEAKPKCEYCGGEANPDSTKEIKYTLCDECWEAYDNRTGHCSLDCCVSGKCDSSC